MQQINDEEYKEPYSDFDNILDFWRHFRWWCNFWILGVPWAVIAALSVFWNWHFNVYWNYMWAGGNIFLVGNTIFGFLQALFSVLLVFEIPTWLRNAKLLRFYSFMGATHYNALFLIYFFKAR